MLNRLKRGMSALSRELTKPESFIKGEEFENYVRNIVFPKDRYDIIHRSHNYEVNNSDFVESSLKPDFEFRCRETKKSFHVEAKFRNGTYLKDKIIWCNDGQLFRLQELQKSGESIFLCLGLGGSPKSPEEVFIIPMEKVYFTGFYDSFLDKYDFYPDKPVFSNYLWSLTQRK